MKKTILIFCALSLASVFNHCLAWGPTGHGLVAEIAKHYMLKSVQDSVQKYLGEMTFEKAATWMDDMRKDHTYDYMKTWHYVNIEKDKTYVKNTDYNIINEIDLSYYQLLNRSKYKKEDINTNIKVLFHLIGDIHMPLHSGYDVDRGGNSIDVDFIGKKENLHHVWDVDIIENRKITADECIQLETMFSKKQLEIINKIDAIAWVSEGRMLLPNVYDFKDGKITQEYIDLNTPTIKKQLLLGGMRVASAMNKVFS